MFNNYSVFLPKKIRKVGFLFLSLLFLYNAAYSQVDNYVIKQYTSENGLPQNSVKSIKFDRSGFCWLATEAGIVRFDHHNFKSYGSDVIKGLKSERIVAMMADTAGNIFAQALHFQNIKISGSSSPYSFLPILDDTTDYSFVTWGYLTKCPTVDSIWQSIHDAKNIPVLKTLAGLRNGNIYLFFENDAYFIRKTNITRLKPYDTEPVGSLVLNDRYFLQVWAQNQVKCWDNGVGRTGQMTGDIITNKEYLDGNFKTLWCEQGGFIYAGGSLYRILYINGSVMSKQVLSNLNIEVPLSIAYRPDVNTYFIGTGTQGLFTVKVSDFIYPEIPKESGPENYYTIAKTSVDDIIVNNVIVHPNNTATYVPLHNSNNRASYTDKSDRIYYENEFQLCRYNTATRKIDTLQQVDNHLLAILPDIQDKTLLLCTHSSLYKTTPDGNIIWQKKFPQGQNATGLLPLTTEQYLLSTSVGLKWYNPQKNITTRTILDSFQIRAVYKDKHSRLWIGTDGNGSFLYTEDQLYPLPPGPGGSFRSIHSFIEDNSGNFWLPTNNGLYKVAVNDLADYTTGKTSTIFWFTFNKANGLRTTEFNGGANPNFQWLKDGALILPSINGLVKFYPHQLTMNYPGEQIFIDEITIDGQKTDLATIKGAIQLKPTFQALLIKVACPYFGNSDNLKLEYKIGVEDGQWVTIPASGIISINRLPANDYTLTVRKAGSNSDTPNGNITLNMVVTPFFYRTSWFLGGIILLIASLGYLYARRRVVKLEKEKVKIEKIVEVRTEELSAAIHQLENSETALKKSNEVKEQIIATVLHDLRSPLFSMRVTGKSLVKNWHHDSEENFKQLKGLNHLIGELSRFTDQFFSWAASQQDHFKVENTSFSLQQLFSDIEALFTEILMVNNNRFFIPATTVQCYTDRDILVLILRNLVDNANKNTENGIISLKAILAHKELRIQVSDTGKGLNAFQIENFLDKDKAVKNGRMGSVIILEMLSKINGELLVDSEQGKGAVFTIILKTT